MRFLRLLSLVGGLLLLALLVRHFGLDALTAAVAQIAWWQFVLVCLVYGGCLVLDTLGWRATLVADRPPFLRLLAARCAGQAVNVVTALGGVVGESIKAWLLRRDIPYEASVPSLILDKTAEVVAQGGSAACAMSTARFEASTVRTRGRSFSPSGGTSRAGSSGRSRSCSSPGACRWRHRFRPPRSSRRWAAGSVSPPSSSRRAWVRSRAPMRRSSPPSGGPPVLASPSASFGEAVRPCGSASG